MIVLGLSAFVHDSGACLIRDGAVVANVEEERLNRVKHTDAFPLHAIRYVLEAGNLRLSDVDVVAFNWNPYKAAAAELGKLLFAPLLYFKIQQNAAAPKNFRSILASLRLRTAMQRFFPGEFEGKIVWVDHHLAHAASSYFLAPFNREPADVVVVDGHAENCSTSVFSVRDGRFHLQWQAPIWDSLGILYTTFTKFLGYEMYHEGKTMALAAFGRDSYREAFARIVASRPDGTYTLLNSKYLGLWNFREDGLGGEFGPRRQRGEPLEQRHFDIARSMQNCVKGAILHLIGHAGKRSGHRHLCLSGGVFLNCDINREIVEGGSHDRVFVPPFPSDSGGAIGAALYAAHVHCADPPAPCPNFSPYLGPAFDGAAIVAALRERGMPHREFEDPCPQAAQALMEHKIVGWFQGRMESGPRALGNRSILANPASPTVKEHLNGKVKKREWFRPFAPIATREAALEYFELREPLSELTRYMLLTAEVREEYRERLPGITHVDGTARIQVVTEESNPLMHSLLGEFGRRSGFAVLINTSFNVQEPIVCSPGDALDCFGKSGMDTLFIGNYRVDR